MVDFTFFQGNSHLIKQIKHAKIVFIKRVVLWLRMNKWSYFFLIFSHKMNFSCIVKNTRAKTHTNYLDIIKISICSVRIIGNWILDTQRSNIASGRLFLILSFFFYTTTHFLPLSVILILVNGIKLIQQIQFNLHMYLDLGECRNFPASCLY